MQKTTIIIPCYNESQRIDKEAFSLFLNKYTFVSLLFVDDGSTDNTLAILSEFEKSFDNAHVLKLEKNCGKAEAVRLSILLLLKESDLDYVGYFDADLSTSLDNIITFKQILDDTDSVSAVVGSRIKRLGATISRSPVRHFFGRVVATIASNILTLPVYDTQCGAKMFKVSFIDSIFDTPFHTRWLFDIEIFARLNKALGKEKVVNSVVEKPLRAWIDEGNSKITFKDFIRVPLDLIKISTKY